jgi:ACT domain-containing protein
MNKKIRKFAILQSICLSIIASSATGALAVDFDDTENHWASEAIDIWSDHKIIQGYDGFFRPDDMVTRGELAVMLDRIMAYQDTAENTYSDLEETWYTDAILKLSAYEIMQGYNNEIRPEDPITREEAAVMLVRALKVASQDEEVPSFTDVDNISDWAEEAIYSLANKGLVNGFEDNSFRPQNNMSRAEFVTIINNAVKGFYTKAGTYTSDEKINGIVIVNAADVILEDMEIEGDLILAPGVKDGVVTLKNTTVSGEIITLGGSLNEDNEGSDENQDASPKPTSTPGSSGGSGGGGGGSSISTAAETSIIVNSSYEGKTGTVVSNRKRYTMGKNAFASLKEAVEKASQLEKETQITLLSDLNSDETIEINSDNITLDGGKHTIDFAAEVKDGIQVVNSQNVSIKNIIIKMQDEADKWNGSYGIQAYGSAVSLSDVSVSGADAAVLVNGAEVNLEGIVDVSGNEFGGIEVSKGADIETMPKLRAKAENLKNDSESVSNPTIWIDKVSELTTSVVEAEGLIQSEQTEKDQMYYYLSEQIDGLTVNVTDQEGLETALADEEVAMINVTENINIDKTINVDRPIIIKGVETGSSVIFENTDGFEFVNAGNVKLENIKIEINDNEEGWQGLYGIQAYGKSKIVFKNISVTGADGAILVNGAEAVLDGTVDVSGNEFGGIEVSKGADVETMPKLIGVAENLKNDTESASNPTIWIDKYSSLSEDVVEVAGLEYVEHAEKDQKHYFINGIPQSMTAEASTLESLNDAISNPEIKVITITDEINADEVLSINRSVVLKGQKSDAKSSKSKIIFNNIDGIEIVDAGNVTIEDINIEITNNEEGWQGLYGVQVYGETKALLKDISVMGADGGILINGAEVELDGVVDVSDNEFGGIEMSKGVYVETSPKLIGSVINLKNSSESTLNPTIWIDKVSEISSEVVEIADMYNVHVSEKDQLHFFINNISE